MKRLPVLAMIAIAPVYAATQHAALRDSAPAALPAAADQYLNLNKASIGGPHPERSRSALLRRRLQAALGRGRRQ